MKHQSHLFISYARVDDLPVQGSAGPGWVTGMVEVLRRKHARCSGRELRVFFDQDSIEEGRDWRQRLGEGIRQSRLFLAFLSPNYLTSPNCLWEWEEYLRREHSSARGDDGLTPIYFIAPDDLDWPESQRLADWLTDMQDKYPWFQARPEQLTADAERLARPFVADVRRRQGAARLRVELLPWWRSGPAVLGELDAGERSEQLRGNDRDVGADLRGLDERLAALDRHIARRLDRIALADLAIGNLPRSHAHFVGRHQELRALHEIMLTGGAAHGDRGSGGRGLIAATFSPGGLGKTALARQYAHAYAEFYAAGGLWELPCEGATDLGSVLLRLADSENFRRAALRSDRASDGQPEYLVPPLVLEESHRRNTALAAEAILHYLKRVTFARVEVLRQELRSPTDRHAPDELPTALETPRALLILDNVDKAKLLSASQLSRLPNEPWLEVIVTTRLDPAGFGDRRSFAAVEVGVLPLSDAFRLLADHQPGEVFASADEEDAAREIATKLGGWTLAVEIAAAFIGDLARRGRTQPARQFLSRLDRDGLAWVDDLAGHASFARNQRHAESVDENERKRLSRIGTLIDWSMERISEPARCALRYAGLMMPDRIPLAWLKSLTAVHHPEIDDASLDNDNTWPDVWTQLKGLGLLQAADELEQEVAQAELVQLPAAVRIHRLVAEHVSASDQEHHARFRALLAWMQQMAGGITKELNHSPGPHSLAVLRDLVDQAMHVLAPVADDRDRQSRAQVPAGDARLDEIVATLARAEEAHGVLDRAIMLVSLVPTVHNRAAREQGSQDDSSALGLRIVFSRLLMLRMGAGDAAEALSQSEYVKDAFEATLASNPQSKDAQKGAALSLSTLADILLKRGGPDDFEIALSHCERAVVLREAIMVSDPECADAQQQVAVHLDRLSDTLLERRGPDDFATALSHCQRSLAFREAILGSSPESAQARREASLSLERLAEMLLVRGGQADFDLALAYRERSLTLREAILVSNPESAQAQKDVAGGLGDLAEILLKRGGPADFATAVSSQERSLALREAILVSNPKSAEAQKDVAAGLCDLAGILLKRGGPGDFAAARLHRERSLAYRETILRSNPESLAAKRGVAKSLDSLADTLASGRPVTLGRELSYRERSLELREAILKLNPGSAQAQREVSVSLDRFADTVLTRGRPDDLALALSHRERSLALLETVLVSNPGSAEAQANVAWGLSNLADVLQIRGAPADFPTILSHRERSKTILEAILASSPDSASAVRDVAVSHSNLADFLLDRGGPEDFAASVSHYERTLALLESILVASPESAQAKQEVSTALGRLANALSGRGWAEDIARILSYRERILASCDSILVSNPESRQAQREVAVSLDELAYALLVRGDPADLNTARSHSERGLALRESILTSVPESTQAQREVAISLDRLANFLMVRREEGDLATALRYRERSLTLLDSILTANPESSRARYDVAVSLGNISDVLEMSQDHVDFSKVLLYRERSLRLCEMLLASSPESARMQRDVSIGLFKLANTMLKRGGSGDITTSISYVERSLALSEAILVSNADFGQAQRDAFNVLTKLAEALETRGREGDDHRAQNYRERVSALQRHLGDS